VKQLGKDGDYVLRLSPLDGSGVPTNTVLVETAAADATVPLGESMVSFSFAAPFFVAAGTQYALVLTQRGAFASSGASTAATRARIAPSSASVREVSSKI
jgi:hypothetical protein